MRINKQVVNLIVDREMQSVKGMKKTHLVALVRDLMEDKVLEWDDKTIYDAYCDIVKGNV